MVSASDRGRDVLLPNLLSFARIPLAGLLWLAPFEPAWTLSVLVLAGVSDVLDGWLVRRARERRVRDHDPGAFSAPSTHGAFIDGFADKVFVVSAIALLAFTLRPPWWVLAVLASREILFVPMMLAYRLASEAKRASVDFTAGPLGKLTTLAQYAALVLGLFDHPWFTPAALGAGSLGAIATLYYFVRASTAPSPP